ncbi:MAG: acyl-CoA dehydrogenase [Gemmatimonadetes bacterium]|nr:acyl-CoA dehydrogenase [Gemmatimonadota bacterium]
MTTLTHPPALTALTEDEAMFREAARDFAESEVAPRVSRMEAARHIDSDLISLLFELGFMGMEIPEHFGGTAGSFFTAVLVVEELSRVDPSVGVLVDVQNTLVNNALLSWGTPEQLSRHLPPLASGTVGAYALSEAGSGSDAFALASRAVRDGSDWVLNGRKMWITSGAEAGLFIIFANVEPEMGYKGITAFIVERDMPGFSVGKKEDKLGIRASSTTELVLDDVRVPRENVLGEPGQGYKVAIETLNEGRIGIGAQMVGLAQGAFDHTAKYVQEREQFGRPIAEFQAVQFQLAEIATEIEAARLMVYNAARLKDQGSRFLREGAMAKLFASRMAQEVSSICIDLHGGYGFTREYPVEKYYRDAKIGTIYEGTSNMQLQTIAKDLLRG